MATVVGNGGVEFDAQHGSNGLQLLARDGERVLELAVGPVDEPVATTGAGGSRCTPTPRNVETVELVEDAPSST